MRLKVKANLELTTLIKIKHIHIGKILNIDIKLYIVNIIIFINNDTNMLISILIFMITLT